MWGKPHASKTAFLKALENVTIVTFVFLSRGVITKVYMNLWRGEEATLEPAPDTP